ncbi:MAG TPA: hypothetical protein VGB91_13595 [Rhizomicrobium sp.]
MLLPSALLREVKAILERNAGKAAVAPKLKDSLLAMAGELDGIAVRLTAVEDSIVLDSDDPEKARIARAAQLWKGWPANAPGAKAKIDLLVQASPLLDSLFRRAIDINGMRKFSVQDFGFAIRIGDDYEQFSTGLRDIRRMTDGKEGEKKGSFKCSDDNRAFIAFLKSAGVAEPGLMLLNGERNANGEKKHFKLEWFSDHPPDRSVFTVLKMKSAARFRLLQGEWLTAYVYQIIDDHLRRNRESFELYTDVSYRMRGDIGGVAGDFDVLGKVRSRVVCVECKTGFAIAERNTVQAVIDKTTALRAAVDAVSQEKMAFHFYLVFDPHQNDEDEIAALLNGTGIIPLRPDQVRAEIVANILS